MSENRGQFSSRLGFILAAAGSAVGLGNVWGFPTNVASNGGAAFVLVYLILAFFLAYPVLMVELTLGRYSNANVVSTLEIIGNSPNSKRFGKGVGYYAVITSGLVLSFYCIIAGWVIAFMLEPLSTGLGFNELSNWLTTPALSRNILFAGIFIASTGLIVINGIESGIEKFSSLMMPLLLALLVGLILYTLAQDGAMDGLRVYLLPDFKQILNPQLLINALGQAFFSLSLGVGGMLIYGSYLNKNDNLPKLGGIITLIDCSIAFAAGLLIIPAVFIAQKNGTVIYDEAGQLFAGPDLIFQVLPKLFETMGTTGTIVAFAFFSLLTIAALTSSIGLLEVSVSMLIERFGLSRKKAALVCVTVLFLVACGILSNFEGLFGFVISFTTEFNCPLISVFFCLYLAWIWNRNSLLNELKNGHPEIEQSFFWKWWPAYVKYFCPVLILIVLLQTFIS